MNNKQDKGFTLVELLIVIVILGILATVTVFAVRGITDRGQDNACAVERRTLDTAIEAYYANNQTDPTSMAQLTGGATPLLKDDPTVAPTGGTANWTFTPGTPAVGATPGTSATFNSINKCAGA